MSAFGWAAAGGVILVLALWLLRLCAHRMLYKPVRLHQAPVPQLPPDIDFSHAWVTTRDGLRLHGWWCRRPENPTTLLICHGNTGSVEGREDTVQFYMNMGLNVFIFDYRGYGVSEGHPSESGTYHDIDAAWDYLRHELNLDTEKIVLLGRSLGAAIAAHLAQHARPAAVILESTFTSIPDLAAELHGWSKLLFSINLHYATVEKIKTIQSPLMIVHSGEDELIGLHHAQKLMSLAPLQTRFLEISGRHRDGFVSSSAQYIPGIVGFLRDHQVPLGPCRSST